MKVSVIMSQTYRYNVMPVSIQQAAPYNTYWENSRGKGWAAALYRCIAL